MTILQVISIISVICSSYYNMKTYTVSVSATIIKYSRTKYKRDNVAYYKTELEYVVDGEVFHGTKDIPYKLLRNRNNTRMKEYGERISILINPANPEQFTYESRKSIERDYHFANVILGFMGFMVIWMIIIMIQKKQAPRQEKLSE